MVFFMQANDQLAIKIFFFMLRSSHFCMNYEPNQRQVRKTEKKHEKSPTQSGASLVGGLGGL